MASKICRNPVHKEEGETIRMHKKVEEITKNGEVYLVYYWECPSCGNLKHIKSKKK